MPAQAQAPASWISAAEAALNGHAHAGTEIEVLERKPPPVFDTAAARALVSPLLAACVWGATLLREMLAKQPLDGLALLLRVLALALSVRALLALYMLWQRLGVRAALQRYGLAIAKDGLFYRSPTGDVVVPREHILEVREEGDWRERSGRRWAEVYVVTTPDSGRTHVGLPPLFLDTSGVLAERLMRWLAEHPAATAAARASLCADPDPDEALPSKLWDRLRSGERPRGITVLLHGHSWLQRGPYVSLLLGIAVLSGYVRISAAARAAIGLLGPLALLITLGVVPVVWVLLTRAQLATRGGIALVLTGTEALLRTRAGVHRVRWRSVTAVSVESRSTWSLLRGARHERTLLLRRGGDDDVRYQEAFLGAPLDVVIALCEAYRRSAQASAPTQGADASTPAS